MSFNTAKIINVYYKSDRKPYDANGKPISYFGEDFVGSNEATEIRFYMPNEEDLGAVECAVDVKRANGDKRYDLLTKIVDGLETYYKLELNDWYSAYVGKVTIAFKAYKGGITIVDGVITSVTAPVYVSDIFHLQIAYAPNSTEEVPPFDPSDVTTFLSALSAKLNVNNGIFVIASSLPSLVGGVYNGQWFLVKNNADGSLGKLYYINGSTAEEVELNMETLKLTPTGNGDITTNTGKLNWEQPNGTVQLGLYNDVNMEIGEDVFYYGKASATITKGQVIQFGGYQGDHILMKPAVPAEINANPKLIMGIAKHNIANNDFGYVLHFGKLDGVDTGSFVAGNLLYFSSSSINNGELTSTIPTAPNAKILMCAVIKAETSGPANNGVYQVRINIEPKLGDLQDVNITSVANKNVLRYNSANSRWENVADLTTAESDIDSLEGRMTTAEGDIDSLEGRMTTAESNILNIEDGTTVVTKALSDQNGDVINTTYLKIGSASATYIPLSQKGANNGVVPLNSNGKISSQYLSGEQDDYIEFADLASFPLVGEADIIYCAIDTGLIYRWTGSTYAVISPSLALGTTATTAYRGDLGQNAYDNANTALDNTENIIDGTQTLTNTRITNSAVGTSPLIVNGVASTTADLIVAQLNTSARFRVGSGGDVFVSGGFNTPFGLYNSINFNNSSFQTTNNGGLVSRNINDTNSALIVRKQQGTGNILELQVGSSDKKLEVDVNGWFYQNGTRLLTNFGTQNIFVGIESGNTTTTGIENTGIGYQSLVAITSGTRNTALGRASLSNLSSGGNNTAIGNGSGQTITTGSDNTFLGRSSGTNASQLATATNSTALGQGAFTDASNQMVFGNASVTQFKFDRNASATILAPQITASSPNLTTITRTSTITDGLRTALSLKHTTSGNMVDGFGTIFGFDIQDDAGVSNNLGFIAGIRSGADNSGRLSFQTNNAGTTTEKMTIMPDGKVGIGTASPATPLTVVASSNTLGLQIRRNSNSDSNNDYALLSFRVSSIDGDISSAEIRGLRTNRAVAGDSDLQFYTRSNSVTVERMRIRDDGNVGIGTSSPGAKLHIFDANPMLIIQDSETTSSSTDSRIRLAESGVSNVVNEYVDLRKNGDDFQIDIYNGATTITPFVVKYAGLVGINETSPTAQLQVKSGATNRVPLIVDTVASHTANLQNWQINGVLLARVSVTGRFASSVGIGGLDQDDSFVETLTTGVRVSHNRATTNPALIVNLQNSSATGNIQVWQKAGTAQLAVNGIGKLINTTNSANASVHLSNQGVVIERDIADANVPLTVNQNNATATGNIQNWAFDSGVVAYVEADGDIYNDNGTYGTASDIRIKENVVEARNYTEDLMKLRVVKYSLKKEKQDKPTHLGFIAQEFEQVFPNMVSTSERDDIADFKSIKMSVLIPMLVKTIQELKKELDEVKKKIG
jgi:hypothetical protein